MHHYLIGACLIDLARREFPSLMEHPDHREDALQTLALVQFATGDPQDVETAHQALAWLEYELVEGTLKPIFPKPHFSPPSGQLGRGTFLHDLSAAVEAERLAA